MQLTDKQLYDIQNKFLNALKNNQLLLQNGQKHISIDENFGFTLHETVPVEVIETRSEISSFYNKVGKQEGIPLKQKQNYLVSFI